MKEEFMSATLEAGRNSSAREGKFLTFLLAGEEYGIEILKVQEIIGIMPITTVPRTPKFIKGVINLRGKVIPVMDLRLKFDLESAEHTAATCVIVVQSGAGRIGLIVDKVCEVLYIGESNIEDAPALGAGVDTSFILGIGKSQGKVKLLLDIDKVLSNEDLDVLLGTVRQGAK
jgi:purine-binding chemotaxis protein CheW